MPKVLENTLLYGCTCLVVFASRTIMLRGRGTRGEGRGISLNCKAEEGLLKQNGVNLLRRALNYKGAVKTLRPSQHKKEATGIISIFLSSTFPKLHLWVPFYHVPLEFILVFSSFNHTTLQDKILQVRTCICHFALPIMYPCLPLKCLHNWLFSIFSGYYIGAIRSFMGNTKAGKNLCITN